MSKMSVKFFRAAGLEARWTKTSAGQPCIVLRNPKASMAHQRDKWWVLSDRIWNDITAGVDPVEVFDRHTMLGDLFSIPA